MSSHDRTSDRRSVTRGLVLGTVTAAAALTGWRPVEGAVAGTGPVPADTRRQVQVPEGTGALTGIGLPMDDWDAIYGERIPLDDAHGLFACENPDFPGLALLVAFTDGLVNHLEYGYEESDAGGVAPGDVAAQIAGVLPADAEPTQQWLVNGTTVGSIVYRYERYESAALDRATDGRFAILVGYQEQNVFPADGGAPDLLVLRATVTVMSPAEPREATGEPGGLGLSLANLEDVHGPAAGTQSGYLFAGQAALGGDILAGTAEGSVVMSLRFTYDGTTQYGGIGLDDAGADLAGALPADATRDALFVLPPTPGGPIGLAVEQWQSDTLAETLGGAGTALTVTWQQDVAGATVVSRIDVVAEAAG